MKLKIIGAGLIVAALLGVSLQSAVAAPPAGSPAADAKSDYIVVYKDNADVGNEVIALKSAKIEIKRQYANVLKGALVSMTTGQADALSKRATVDSVSADGPVQATATATLKKQDLPTTLWGLDRIDQQNLPLSNTFSYTSDGTGVTAFIVDTGINASHTEFAGRILPGQNFAPNANNATLSSNTDDCAGHGTHVSSTVGGTTFGVAKNVKIVPVRVLDCNGSGTISGVISGLNWIAGRDHTAGKEVANMSLGGAANTALDTAVKNLIQKGVQVVVAAGNDSRDACNSSPARVPSAVTVAASDNLDRLAWFSNYGSCVDIIAPGVDITGAWIGVSNTATNTISGTSMATPHVTGTIAAALASGKTSADVLANATPGKIVLPGKAAKTPNKLLFFNY